MRRSILSPVASMAPVGRGVIDGDRWIGQRLAFLRDLLKTELTDEQRKAVEEEIGRLSKERGIHIGGRRRWWSLSGWIARRGKADSVETGAAPAGPADTDQAGNEPRTEPGAEPADQPQPSSSSRESEMPK